MNYPIWQLGYPGGMLIALIAILHVTVSHFAIGGGAYLVLTEARADRRNDAGMLEYVKRHSQFFALLTLVFGAVTGVGIWFTIGLVSPEATSSMIHTYVWAWATEWVFFIVEITAAIVYAKSWSLDRKTHLAIGWIYFISAWMSLFIINGIITYQLTPGRWTQTHGFWDGFFNPTFWPSLVTRTAMSTLLAGLFGYVTLGRELSEARDRLTRWASAWVLTGALMLVAGAYWYFAALPGFSKAYFAGSFKALTHGVRGGLTFATIVVIAALLAMWKPRAMRVPATALVLVCGLGMMGSGEYMREFVRKPWVIQGFIYGNDVRAADIEPLTKDGAAAHAHFVAIDAQAGDYGRQLFILECSSCHSIDGYRSMRTRVKGWDADFAKEMLAHMEKMRAPMPQFGGNEADRIALGKYLASLNPPEVHVNGERAFQVHCGSCHTINGNFRPLRGAFQGSKPEEVENVFPVLDQMSPNMPHFAAPEDDAKALAAYISAEANKPVTAESGFEKPIGGGVR